MSLSEAMGILSRGGRGGADGVRVRRWRVWVDAPLGRPAGVAGVAGARACQGTASGPLVRRITVEIVARAGVVDEMKRLNQASAIGVGVYAFPIGRSASEGAMCGRSGAHWN